MEIQKSPRWRQLYPPKVEIATASERNAWAICAVGGDAKTLGPSSALIRVPSVFDRRRYQCPQMSFGATIQVDGCYYPDSS